MGIPTSKNTLLSAAGGRDTRNVSRRQAESRMNIIVIATAGDTRAEWESLHRRFGMGADRRLAGNIIFGSHARWY